MSNTRSELPGAQIEPNTRAHTADTWIGGRPGRATPIRGGEVAGTETGVQGALLSQDVRGVLEKCLGVAGALYTRGQWGGLEEWLAGGAAQVLEFYTRGGEQSGTAGGNGGAPVGAWMALVTQAQRIESRRVVGLAQVGYPGFSPEQVADVAHGVCLNPSTWSEVIVRQVGGSPVLGSQARVVQVPSASDQAVRVTTPLGRFVRGVVPIAPAGDGRALLWQVDGKLGGWTPTGQDAAAGEGLSLALPQAYTQTVHRRGTQREKLTRAVSASQSQILPLLAKGLSQRQISQRVSRSLHTVHDHVKGIYAALGIKSRYQLYVLWNGGDPSGVDGED